MITKDERETILRWDDASEDVLLYTASPVTARKWTRLGYDLKSVSMDREGKITGWEGTAGKKAVTVRRVKSHVPLKRTSSRTAPAGLIAYQKNRKRKTA